MKRQDKSSEKQLNEVEIGSFPEKEFNARIVCQRPTGTNE